MKTQDEQSEAWIEFVLALLCLLLLFPFAYVQSARDKTGHALNKSVIYSSVVSLTVALAINFEARYYEFESSITKKLILVGSGFLILNCCLLIAAVFTERYWAKLPYFKNKQNEHKIF